MNFDEEEDDEEEDSSSSCQLNSNTRPGSTTSKKSGKVRTCTPVDVDVYPLWFMQPECVNVHCEVTKPGSRGD